MRFIQLFYLCMNWVGANLCVRRLPEVKKAG